MESNFDEDITKLSYSEIKERIERVRRDKRFVSYKVEYWKEQYSKIYNLEKVLVDRITQVQHVCEVCNAEVLPEGEMMRTLPDGRRVCKSCWKSFTEDTLIKNANQLMQSSYQEGGE